MKKNNNYHLFLFFMTFTRGIVETFSLVLLYKKNFSIDYILLFMTLMYGFGIFVNYISLKLNYKLVLIISSLLYGISYLYLTIMDNSLFNLIIFAILLSFSTYSYHSIRHYLALNLNINNTSLIVNITYFGIIIASIIGTYLISKLSIYITSIILFILSLISLIPIFKLKLKINSVKKNIKLDNRKVLFNIFEQCRVIFIELQPLFLYTSINESTLFVGGFNIVINIASFILLFIIRKVNICSKYLYICFLLGIILLFKISITNSIILFLIAIMEGVFIKMYERGSLSYLYDINNNSIKEYLNLEEFIFFISKFTMMVIFLLLGIELRTILFICIIGIVISGFIYEKN